jgi:hypothetical protein
MGAISAFSLQTKPSWPPKAWEKRGSWEQSRPRRWSVGARWCAGGAASMTGGSIWRGCVRKRAAKFWYRVPSNPSILMRQGLHCSYAQVAETWEGCWYSMYFFFDQKRQRGEGVRKIGSVWDFEK